MSLFVIFLTLTQVKIYRLYVNPFYKYNYFTFSKFIVICEHHNEQLSLVWVAYENEAYLYYLPFDIGDQKYELLYCVGVEGAYIHVHHFREIEMLPKMRWHAQRLLQSCVLSFVGGSSMQKTWLFLAWCTQSTSCVNKLLHKTFRFK